MGVPLDSSWVLNTCSTGSTDLLYRRAKRRERGLINKSCELRGQEGGVLSYLSSREVPKHVSRSGENDVQHAYDCHTRVASRVSRRRLFGDSLLALLLVSMSSVC